MVFGYEFEPAEIQVDSIPLSMYLSSLEAMIGQMRFRKAPPRGNFCNDHRGGQQWQLVMHQGGVPSVEACNYDATSTSWTRTNASCLAP